MSVKNPDDVIFKDEGVDLDCEQEVERFIDKSGNMFDRILENPVVQHMIVTSEGVSHI